MERKILSNEDFYENLKYCAYWKDCIGEDILKIKKLKKIKGVITKQKHPEYCRIVEENHEIIRKCFEYFNLIAAYAKDFKDDDTYEFIIKTAKDLIGIGLTTMNAAFAAGEFMNILKAVEYDYGFIKKNVDGYEYMQLPYAI